MDNFWYYSIYAIILLLLLFFIYRVVKDNYPLFRDFGKRKKELKGFIIKTGKLWWPMLIPIFLGYYFDFKTEEFVENKVYENKFLQQKNTEERNFIEDIDFSLNIFYEKTETKIYSRLDSISKITENAKDSIPSILKKAINSSFVPTTAHELGMPPNKPIWRFRRHAKRRMVKTYNQLSGKLTKQSNESIQKTINEIANKSETSVKNILSKTDSISDLSIDEIKPKVHEELKENQQFVFKNIINTYYLILTIRFILRVMFVLVVIKSILYVFARIIFKKNKDSSGLTFSLNPGQITRNGSLTNCQNKYNINGQSKETYYIKRTESISGADPVLSFPQFARCFFARVFTRNFILTKIDMKDYNAMTVIRVGEGKELIEYNLNDGETCVFRFKHLVGMSSTVKLSTKYNFQLSNFLFQKFRFSTAKGPGKLIFKSKGGTIISPQNDSKKSVALSRIMAFQDKASFSVGSSLKILDVFFSNFNLSKENNGNIIIDGPTNKNMLVLTGIFKFFWRFLIPF